MTRAARVFPVIVFLLLGSAITLLAVHKVVSTAPIFVTWFEPTVNGLAFGTLATVVLRHQPGTRMGWVFAALSLLAAVQVFNGEYAVFAEAVHPLPAAGVTALVAELMTPFVLPLVVVVVLLYPDGRPITWRWRLVLQLIVATAVVEFVPALLHSGGYDDLPGYTNPLGVTALSPVIRSIDQWAARVEVVCLATAMIGVGLRYRRAGSVVRQQLKWFGLAVGLFVALLLAIIPAQHRLPNWAGHVAFGLGLVGFAVAIGFAILRYRLYDIDRIVSRTVGYAVVSGVLVAAYVGIVTAVTRLTPTNNSLEVDLGVVRADLLSVVNQTMEPAVAGIWLRESRGPA